ncbi:type III secretion protein [Paraburkholderia sp. UYCP14C]|uniref:type III secretion protein HrpB4 n=1 Tax=Paraburkholderia sp. UYCP14C TaxID=2511130 RepID=UPI00101F6708|nr:type III secretion protein HrpB4 [Paraburkholderia sp. UYCP14C]RZF23576.1 type III secretion protein [Paraburkholderia sp. UYCP14C]
MAASTLSLSALSASESSAFGAVSSVAATAAALAAWQRNASEAARWAHPSWWAPAFDVKPAIMSASFDALREALASTHAGLLAGCSRALLRAADVAKPEFDSLRALDPAVLDALPVDDGLRVLRMRALLMRRADVRRLIDKRSRRRLAQWVGVPLERLSAAPLQGTAHVSANATDVAGLVARGQLPPLEEIDEERLACEGYALIAQDMHEAAQSVMPARAPHPCALLRLALPRDLPPWLGARVRGLDLSGTALLFAQLPELLPEWAWLFG